jgi:hypothetical protein
MAFFWIQYWGPLPTIDERIMGDKLPGSQPVGDFSNRSPTGRNLSRISPAGSYDSDSDRRKQFQDGPQLVIPQGNYQNMQSFPSHSSQGRPEAFNMAAIGTALPNMAFQNYSDQSAQRYATNISPTHPMYQVQGVPHYSSLPTMNPTNTNLPYNTHLPQQYPGVFTQGQSQPSQTGMGAGHPMYQQYYVQPGQYVPQNQVYLGASGGSMAGQYGGRGGPFPTDGQPSARQRSEYSLASSTSGPSGRAGASSVVRGPPRKPRQSGK